MYTAYTKWSETMAIMDLICKLTKLHPCSIQGFSGVKGELMKDLAIDGTEHTMNSFEIVFTNISSHYIRPAINLQEFPLSLR